MNINKRITHALVILFSLMLVGFNGFQCSQGNTNSGSTDTRIRVSDEQKISAGSGNFDGKLTDGDQFGSAVADLGDLEADGVRDLAVGVPFDDDNGNDRGAVWVLFMDDNGRVDQEQKISSRSGGFNGNLDDDDRFGSAVAGIGDLNGDGVFDMAVGVPGDDKGGTDRGGLWILFLDTAGKVQQEERIADGDGGFDGNLSDDDRLGSAVSAIGDVNGDGVTDLAVGAPNDDDGPDNAGAVWILFMNSDGRVDAAQKISAKEGDFDGSLDADDHFGAAVAGIGDLDNDGIPDLAVGAPGRDDNGTDRGAIWILFLDNEGKVLQEEKIADGGGGFNGDLADGDGFGSAVADIGDLNGDGVTDLAVGAPNDKDGSDNAGALWVLLMQADGRVDGWQKVSGKAGGFGGSLEADDHFGAAAAGIGDLDGDGIPDLVTGAPGDDDGGVEQGALWVLFMDVTGGTP